MPLIHWMTKRLLLPALVLALATPLVQASPGGEGAQSREANRPNAQQRQAQQSPNDSRAAAQRAQRRDEGNAGEKTPRQRLSPEERRQLRRDVHNAGREIYRR
jgi:hypothetical protein